MQKSGLSEYKMIDVGAKEPTHRVCLATGILKAQKSTLFAIQNGTLPKGNVLPLAEAAGIIAVKKTSEILPLCHPLPIDAATIHFEFEDSAVRVFCEVSAHAKTGVEMEALNGVNAALLCIYDLTKGIDPALELSDIHLIEKRGGKSGVWRHPKLQSQESPKKSSIHPTPINSAIITLSDRASSGEYADESGRALLEYAKLHWEKEAQYQLLPDSAELLREALTHFTESHPVDLILTTGGTGVGPRDLTPETIQSLGGKRVPGFGELIRTSGARSTPFAYLSRAEAVIVKNTLIICLPGSKKGAIESLESIAHLLPHTLKILKGANHG